MDEKAAKSRACSPIAIAGRGDGEEVVVMIPNGMLASEKWDARGIGSQDVAGITIDSRIIRGTVYLKMAHRAHKLRIVLNNRLLIP